MYYLFIIGKWNKIVLIYAVKNGYLLVVVYFFRIGVDLCVVDTFGNILVYYVVVYGWLYCLKMFVKVGVDLNVVN